VQKKKHFNIDA